MRRAPSDESSTCLLGLIGRKDCDDSSAATQLRWSRTAPDPEETYAGLVSLPQSSRSNPDTGSMHGQQPLEGSVLSQPAALSGPRKLACQCGLSSFKKKFVAPPESMLLLTAGKSPLLLLNTTPTM